MHLPPRAGGDPGPASRTGGSRASRASLTVTLTGQVIPRDSRREGGLNAYHLGEKRQVAGKKVEGRNGQRAAFWHLRGARERRRPDPSGRQRGAPRQKVSSPHAVQPQPTRRHSLVQAWNAQRDRGKGRPRPEGGRGPSRPLTNTNAALRSPCNRPRAHSAPEHTRPPLPLEHGQDPKSRCSVDATSPSQGELTLALTPCFRGTISRRG